MSRDKIYSLRDLTLLSEIGLVIVSYAWDRAGGEGPSEEEILTHNGANFDKRKCQANNSVKDRIFKRTLKQTLIHLKTSFLFLTNPSASSMAYLVSMTFEYADEDQH